MSWKTIKTVGKLTEDFKPRGQFLAATIVEVGGTRMLDIRVFGSPDGTYVGHTRAGVTLTLEGVKALSRLLAAAQKELNGGGKKK